MERKPVNPRAKKEYREALERLKKGLEDDYKWQQEEVAFSAFLITLIFIIALGVIVAFSGCGHSQAIDASRPLAVAQQLHYEGCMDTEVLPPKLCLDAYRELRDIESAMERHDTEHKLMSVQFKAGLERALTELARQFIYMLPTQPQPPIKPILERL